MTILRHPNVSSVRKGNALILLLSSLFMLPVAQAAPASPQTQGSSTDRGTPNPAAISVNLPQQSLRESLNGLANQTGLQILWSAEELPATLEAPKVQGKLTPQAALDALLKDSGLRYDFLDADTVAITNKKSALNAGEANLRLVQNPQTASTQSAKPRDEGDDDQKIQEIIVTAQKRSERLQDVPISISVLSGEDLDRSTARGVLEELSRVPGVAITDGFQGNSMVTVRGVGAAGPLFAGSSPVSFYLDSVPFATVRQAIAPDAGAYDLERIEVLRGPQGTLYGASAQNGVVRILTKDANLEKVEFKATASASTSQGSGGQNYNGDAALNVPLIDGKLAMRAVAGYQNLAGWIDRPAKEDYNDEQMLTLRLKLNARPTENLSIGLSTWRSRNDRAGSAAANLNQFHPSRADEPIASDYDVHALKIGYELPAFSVASSTSYMDYSLESAIDATALQGLTDQFLTTNLAAKIFTQEVNLNSSSRGPWRWSVGGMYRDAKDSSLQIRRTSAGVPTQGYVAPALVDYLSESYAAFGELTRLIADGRFEVSGGLRYFTDNVGIREISRQTAVGGIPPTGLIGRDDTFTALSPRAALTWHPHGDLTVYTSYAEGFRSGAHQLPTVLFAAPSLSNPDSDNLRNYEVGAKGGFLDGRVAIDTAVYYIDWQDVQQPIVVLIPGTVSQSALVNGESASGFGFDFGVTLKPLDSLTFDLAVSVNDLTQDANVLSNGAILFNKGDRLNYSPKYTVGGSMSYAFPLGANGYRGSFSAAANHTSERSQHALSGNPPVLLIPTGDSMSTAGARLSVSAPNGWTASLFADNITNEDGALIDQSLTQPFAAGTYDVRLRPRTIGLQVEFNLQ